MRIYEPLGVQFYRNDDDKKILEEWQKKGTVPYNLGHFITRCILNEILNYGDNPETNSYDLGILELFIDNLLGELQILNSKNSELKKNIEKLDKIQSFIINIMENKNYFTLEEKNKIIELQHI